MEIGKKKPFNLNKKVAKNEKNVKRQKPSNDVFVLRLCFVSLS
jgi:hypothetical protein